MMTMINRTPVMQVKPSEDIFCCTKKEHTKKTTMKQNSQDM